jgi:hypothetical protein
LKDFARVTKLHDIAGRGDYISNPDRQEAIVAQSAPVDWKPYREFERAHQRTNKANNEGRELIIQLPNGWADLPDGELTAKADRLAETAAGKKTDLQWAVHWNKGHTNLHMHVVFSERTRTGEVKLYDRDIYQTADGKVARRRADRAHDTEGQELPPVHRKGEIASDGFTAKDTRYKAKKWTQEVKNTIHEEMRRLGAVLEPQKSPYELHQYHQGKGTQSADIAVKNRAIKQANEKIREFAKGGMKPENLNKLKDRAVDVLHRSEVPVIMLDKEKSRVSVRRATVQQIREVQHRRGEAPAHIAAPIAEPTSFDVAAVASQLEACRAAFITANMQAAKRSVYRENPIYRQQAEQISECVRMINDQTASIEHFQANLAKLGLFHGREKRDLQGQIDDFTSIRAAHLKRLKELGVSDPARASEAIKKNKELAARELEKVRASRENRGASDRISEARASFLDLARNVPEDERQAVFAEMQTIRVPGEQSIAAYKAEIAAMRDLDENLMPTRASEQELDKGLERSHGMDMEL